MEINCKNEYLNNLKSELLFIVENFKNVNMELFVGLTESF